MKRFTLLLLAIASLTVSFAQNPSLGRAKQFGYYFTQRLLQAQPDKNLFISPLSISTLMAMPYAGAEGMTEQEMKKALYFAKDTGQFSASWRAALSMLDSLYEDQAEFRVANSVWLNKDFSVLPAYRNTVQEDFQAKMYTVDFRNQQNRNKARKKANKWVEKVTNNRIKDLISQDMLTPLTRMLLINAIYFKAAWQMPFNERRNKTDRFYTSDSTEVTATYMRHNGNMRYYAADSLKMVAIPYKPKNLEMFVVLPDKNTSLQKAAALFSTPAYRQEVFNNMRYGQVALAFPKFKVEAKYALKSHLIEMGMPTAFSDTADFSGITGDKSLQVDKVVHQAFIDVNEQGTEAAAATAAAMRLKTAHGRQPWIMKVNRPFLYFIRDAEKGALYFAGALRNPNPGE